MSHPWGKNLLFFGVSKQAAKPDIGSESRFLPYSCIRRSFRGVPVGILLCRLVQKN